MHADICRARIAFMFLSKLYRQMYAGTGISTDSARRKKSKQLGAVDGEAVQEAVPGQADAGAAIAGVANGGGGRSFFLRRSIFRV